MKKNIILNEYLKLDIEVLRKELGETVRLDRDKIVNKIIIKHLRENQEVYVKGILEIVSEHFGFLRFCELDFQNSVNDIYIPLNRKNQSTDRKSVV